MARSRATERLIQATLLGGLLSACTGDFSGRGRAEEEDPRTIAGDGEPSPSDGAPMDGVPADGADPAPEEGKDDAGTDGGRPAASLERVRLRTVQKSRYLGAAEASLVATATTASDVETFTLIDADGGELLSGDVVRIRTGAGSYVQATNGGGSVITLGGDHIAWQSFRVVRKGGDGVVANGDVVGLETSSGANWLSAEDGGGGGVFAYGASLGAWEELVISGLPSDMPSTPSMRVVGYLPNWYGSLTDWVSRVDFAKLTHLNLAFALGDESGNLELAPDDQIAAIVQAAHAHGVKVFPSLCGGGGDGRIAPFYEPDRVDAFVSGIVQFTLAHDLDGIDVDVEAPQRMGPKYDAFIAKLKEQAAPHGLPVTAAVAQWMQSGMSDETLRSFDFITVMSYDATGTWTGAGPHASYAQAEGDIRFYLERGVDPEKLVLGVPFYGYCWGNCNGASTRYVLYKDILARYADAFGMDTFVRDGGTYFYNGVDTMRRKTALAAELGGIMIWELGGDVAASEDTSLLRAIADAMP